MRNARDPRNQASRSWAKVSDANPVFNPADERAQRHHDDVVQAVPFVARLAARIGKIGKLRARVGKHVGYL